MAEDCLDFLIIKFLSDYAEAVEKYRNFPFDDVFQAFRDQLDKSKRLDWSQIEELKACLTGLIDLLAELVMIVEKRRQIKSVISPTRSGKELWNLFRARRKLMDIKKKFEGCRGIEAEECLISSSILVLHPEALIYFRDFKIHGLENQVEEIENLLIKTGEGEHKAIVGIVGVGGSGKTALAISTFHTKNMQNHFELRLWIDLSEATDAEKRYSCILVEKSGYGYVKSPCDYGQDEVLSTLYSYIGNRRCLIVLDGVWHANKGIKDFIEVISNDLGGAVIVTCRFWDVAKFLVEDNHGHLHHIRPLDEEDCWSIFRDSILKKSLNINEKIKFEGKSLQESLPEGIVEDEIKYGCHGLPLAAKTLAEIISTQELRTGPGREWNHRIFDERLIKEMLFEINVHDRVSLSKAWYKIISLPDVDFKLSTYCKNRFRVIGSCKPDVIAMALATFCHAELLSLNAIPKIHRTQGEHIIMWT